MSSHSFSITAATPEVSLGPEGGASVAFTVTNQTTRPLRGQGQARALGSTDASWLKLQGGLEFDFAASESRQISMNLEVPAKAPPGQYRFRLDVCSVANPDDDFTQGPEVSFTVRDTPPPPAPPKPFPLWILLCILGVILVGGGIAVWMLKDPGPPSQPIGNKVVIPKFEDVTLQDAASIPRPANVTIILEPEYDLTASSNNLPKDTILKQDPPPGEIVVPNLSDIRVKVKLQPSMTIMPDLVGDGNVTTEQAVEILRSKDIPATQFSTRTSTKVGKVIDQNPPRNQPIAVGRKVTFHVGIPRTWVEDSRELPSRSFLVKPARVFLGGAR